MLGDGHLRARGVDYALRVFATCDSAQNRRLVAPDHLLAKNAIATAARPVASDIGLGALYADPETPSTVGAYLWTRARRPLRRCRRSSGARRPGFQGQVHGRQEHAARRSVAGTTEIPWITAVVGWPGCSQEGWRYAIGSLSAGGRAGVYKP